MTFAPSTLRALGAYWAEQGGVMLGIVGDASHTSGYHLGKDRIYDGAGPGQGDDDYSVRHPRDKEGLSNAAASIDLGRLNGSYRELQDFSNWLVAACKAGDIGSGDVREIIYSPDGERVQRYSGIDKEIHTGPGNGNSGHRTHTHISYFRDSEDRDKLALFAPYWEDVMGQPTITNTSPLLMDIPKGAVVYAVDGVTPAGFSNAFDRKGIRSDYGSYKLRSWVFDPDGSEDDRKRSLYWVQPALTYPIPPPEPPTTSPDVLTGDDGSVYRRE